MSLGYFVEILNAHGRVLSRSQHASLPLHLGRSYSNDIILDDPHTAALHAVLELDEQARIILRDLGSENGIKLKGKTLTQIHIDGDSMVQLGRTWIRVRTSDYQVAPEINDAHNSRWQGWPTIVAAIILLCAISLSSSWLDDIADEKISDYIMDLAKWLISAAAWAGIWALANRVFNGATHFGKHLFIFSASIFALSVLGYVFALLGFAFSWEAITHYQSHFQIMIAATALYFQLRLINNKRVMLKLICTALAMLGSSLTLLTNYQHSNQFADSLYMNDILPPAVRMSRNHSLAEFDSDIAHLKADIDKEREKKSKEKAEKNKTQ